jgi:cysteine synthase A
VSILEAIGNTPLIEVPCLAKASGSKILLKCENLNPGGSVKDRAAKLMILKAIERGDLKPGMTIIEGTAGNTGIGLSIVGKALGFKVKIVMPNNQAKEKEKLIEFYGAELILVPPCPFADQKHFYHTARRISEENPEHYFWVNQFENLDNQLAHYETTGPELWEQTKGKIDYLVLTAGSGGTIGGCSKFLKEKNPNLKVILVDPEGSGLANFVNHGEFKSSGSSMTEGIGIMRLVANFKEALIDEAFTLNDQDLVNVAYYVRDHDNIILGSSAALNVAAAFKVAREVGANKTIVTMWCDGGERSASKLYNSDFLNSKNLVVEKELY